MVSKLVIIVLLIGSCVSLPAESKHHGTIRPDNLRLVQEPVKRAEKDDSDLKTDATVWWNNYYRYPLHNNYYYVPSAYSYYTPVYNRWNYNYNWETIPLRY